MLVKFYSSLEDGGPVLLAVNQTASEPGTDAVAAMVGSGRVYQRADAFDALAAEPCALWQS